MPDAAANLAAADLRARTSGADPSSADVAELHAREIVLVGHLGDAARPRLPRRPGVERVDVAQQHEHIGVHEHRDERREAVVVAEADLLRRDGVVLVDDRQDAQPQEPLEGALGVAAVGGVLHVARGEQHLAGDDAVAVERLLVAEDQHVLADRRGGLLRGQVRRAGLESEERDARGDGPGRHQDDLGSARVGCGEGIDERTDLADVGPAHRRRADLDDDAPGAGDAGAVRHAHSPCSVSTANPSSSTHRPAARSASSSARAAALASMRSR